MAIFKFVAAIWGVIECLFLSGVIFGWGSFVFVFKDEGLYYDLCDEENITEHSLRGYGNATSSPANITTTAAYDYESTIHSCVAQEKEFATSFIIGSISFPIFTGAMGFICLKLGLRVVRVIILCVYVAGTLCFAFASNNNPWLIYPGSICMVCAGIAIFQTNVEIGYMFDKGGSIVIAGFSGGTDSSAMTALLIKIAYQHGIKRQHSFFFLTGLVVFLVSISTFFFLPKDHVKKKEDHQAAGEMDMKTKSNVSDDSEVPDKLIDSKQEEENIPSVKACIFTSKFLFHIFWFIVLQMRYMYFLQTLNSWISDLVDNKKDEVSFYLNVAMYIMMAGLVFSLFVGFMFDRQIRKYNDSTDLAYRKLMPTILPLTLGCIFSVCTSVAILIPVKEMIYVASVFAAANRAILYSIMVSYVSFIFPGKYITFMVGLSFFSGGVANTLLFAISEWKEAYFDGPKHVNILMLVLSVIALIHPIYQWITCRRINRKEK